VTRYTLSFLDHHGRALRYEMVDCATEAEAINALHDCAGALRVELWLDDQKLLERAGETLSRRPRGSRGRRNPPWAPVCANLRAGA
jgi:hypothetical protein